MRSHVWKDLLGPYAFVEEEEELVLECGEVSIVYGAQLYETVRGRGEQSI